MSDNLTRFLPISKIDEEKRMVWGVASDETVDLDGEIIDYEATKAAVAEWQEWANIREMHQPSAVGVAEEIVLDDTSRRLVIGARVIDDSAWQKVRSGVYKGFSIGGRALKKITDVVNGRVVRKIIDYVLTEVSLVDRPANPAARFTLIKREGDSGMPEKDKPDTVQNPEIKQTHAEEEIQKMDGGKAEEDAPQPQMDAEAVKQIVLELLKELGLVREDEDAEFAQAAEVADLRKSIGKLAPAESLEKVSGNLKKVIGDVAQIANTVSDLEERLTNIEKQPRDSGPVLRELSIGASADYETVFKSLLTQTTDPQMREIIGRELAKMQIKQVHQKKAE